MHKPRIFKEGEGWVLEIGGQEWDCTTWRTAMFAALYHRNYPLDPFWDRGDSAVSEDRGMAKPWPKGPSRMAEMDIRYTTASGVTQWLTVRMEIPEAAALDAIAERYLIPQLAVALNALGVPFSPSRPD